MSKRKRDPFDTSINPTTAGLINDRIVSCELMIGYSFKNLALIMEALNMTSKRGLFQCLVADLPKNNKLAVYGSLVAEKYLCKQWLEGRYNKGIIVQKSFAALVIIYSN